ncbi:MAG: alpha-1,2-fucosyltransferase [Chitinophagales bacterium]
MIKILLTGGLGNQMFQYALGRALSLKNNTDLVLNTSYVDSKLPIKSISTPMRYELDIFDIKATVERNIIRTSRLYPFAKTEYLLRHQYNQAKYQYVAETAHHFQPTFLEVEDNSYLKGNFQSELYFKAYENIIRSDFTFKNPLVGLNKELAAQINTSNAVALHIRRGDYIALKQNVQKFAQIPLSFYHQAIHTISDKIENPVFYVFSDDINWVKTHLKVDFPLVFVSNNHTAKTSYIDMQLMSMCQHQIICNSTFSWWAAWLNNNPHKIVIAPKNWFADNHINSADIIPQQWIKL